MIQSHKVAVPDIGAAVARHSYCSPARLLVQARQAREQGRAFKPLLLGPLSALWLEAPQDAHGDSLQLLEDLLPVYLQLLRQLAQLGVTWVQMDEPVLGIELPGAWVLAFERAYHAIAATRVSVLLSSHFAPAQGNLSVACKLPVAGLHIDQLRSTGELVGVCDWLPRHKALSVDSVGGDVRQSELDAALYGRAPLPWCDHVAHGQASSQLRT